MRAAMARAEVGDDVFRDDPTVIALQDRIAALLGHEAALFMPSGTQSNLAAIISHCARGDEYLVGQQAHCYRYEAGGAAVLGSVQPQPLPMQPDGLPALADIAAAIKPDDEHFARTRLLALENTHQGQVLPQARVEAALALARGFDSVSVCFSKGLGAPVGSALVGGRDFIARAHRARKLL
ncbi:MAG: low-specificity L-threonine aldolase, partial [Burkholderiales bacterium]|nr:low-specificity L-threonine aldolase [Burkholderiales bacterium]